MDENNSIRFIPILAGVPFYFPKDFLPFIELYGSSLKLTSTADDSPIQCKYVRANNHKWVWY